MTQLVFRFKGQLFCLPIFILDWGDFKGQLISECLFADFNFPKNNTKI